MFGYVKKKIVLEEIKRELKIYDNLKVKFAIRMQEKLKDILDEDEFQILVVEPIEIGMKVVVHKIDRLHIGREIADDCELYNSYLDSWYTINGLLERLRCYPVKLREVES